MKEGSRKERKGENISKKKELGRKRKKVMGEAEKKEGKGKEGIRWRNFIRQRRKRQEDE